MTGVQTCALPIFKPSASEAGIEIKGWHTLRHSHTTLLRQNNGDPRVVQGLLRHNSIKVTMDIYDEAMSDEKKMAHRKVLRLVTRKQDRTVMRTVSELGFLQVLDFAGVPDGI